MAYNSFVTYYQQRTTSGATTCDVFGAGHRSRLTSSTSMWSGCSAVMRRARTQVIKATMPALHSFVIRFMLTNCSCC
jgi:hypothetical protein